MNFKLLLVTAVALMMVACGKNSSKNSGSTRINRYNGTGNALVQGTVSCPQGTSVGRIYNNNSSEEEFRQTVANFTFYNLDEIGMISPYYNSNTGIEFTATFAFQNGQVVQGTRAGFKITDSYVGTPSPDGTAVKPIEFVMSGIGGQGSGGQFNVVLGDSKGQARFEGYRTTSQGQPILYGRTYFTNTGQSEQFLGEFVIHACALTGI